ncbi:sensor domain-containing diguanylate cyclase [Salinicola endophyticus]|uniref:Sensor domain-containing diguanylate cyclase n=1 Tax=Salinicola endophyticus TaxID=1949083 RepID=A0ABY8FHB4_9GAMM|nr:diguanylate cyclase [Salinicola endophyticus]WFF42200.1 sensor domain-containing diguanylate cyclase [Salinicola endophyticus]
MDAPQALPDGDAGQPPRQPTLQATLDGLDQLGIAALVYRVEGDENWVAGANALACQQLALDARPPLADPWQWLDDQHQPLAADDHPARRRADSAPQGWRRCHLRDRHGSLRALRLRCRQIEADAGRQVLVALDEITPLDPHPADLPAPTPRLPASLHQWIGSLPIGACVIDAKGYLRLVNPTLCTLLGYAASELLGRPYGELLAPASRERGERHHQAALADGGGQQRVEVVRRDGSLCSVQVADSLVNDADGQPLRLACLVDLTAQREQTRQLEARNRRLEYLATRDEMTGLHNRRYGQQLLEQAIRRSRRYGEPLAVAMLDLDHFKTVNDEHGHAVGDEVLREFSDLVGTMLRQSDTLIRWGGEEFLLLLPGVDRFSAHATLGRVLARLVQQPLSACELQLSFSAGIAEPRQTSSHRLLEQVDTALYQAKQAGRGCITMAEETPQPPALREDTARPGNSASPTGPAPPEGPALPL